MSSTTKVARLYRYKILVVSSRTGCVSVIWTLRQYVKIDVRFFY